MRDIGVISVLAVLAIVAPAGSAFSRDGEGAVAPSSAQAQIKPGKMLYVTKSAAFAPVYSVTGDGNPQVLFEGHRITIPVSTITELDGRLVTSLSKRDLVELGKGAAN